MAAAGLGGGARFLSLDVEGAEAAVLATVDPGLFDVVVVEQDTFSAAKNGAVRARLEAAGLARVARGAFVHSSDVYVRAPGRRARGGVV